MRSAALVYAALAIPVLALSVAAAFVTNDRALLIAAAVGLLASLVTGALTGWLFWLLDLGQRTWALHAVLLCVGAPVLLVWNALAFTAPLWVRSSALADALALAHPAALALTLVSFVSAIHLALDTEPRTQAPTARRYRHALVSERDILPLLCVIPMVSAVSSLTKLPRFADSDRDELRQRMPLYQREAQRYPGHFTSVYRLGNVYTHFPAPECTSGLVSLESAVAMRPSDGWAQNDLGYVLECARRIPEAIPHLAEAVRIMPDEVQPRYNLAWALETTGHPAAEAEYRAILERWPGEVDAAAGAAAARYDRGDREAALAEMRGVVALDPSNSWVQLKAADVLSRAALLREALQHYRAAVTNDSTTSAWAWARYASTAYLANELPESLRAFDHLETLAPGMIDQVPEWRAMRDAARQGTPPSMIPVPPPPARAPFAPQVPGAR